MKVFIIKMKGEPQFYIINAYTREQAVHEMYSYDPGIFHSIQDGFNEDPPYEYIIEHTGLTYLASDHRGQR